MNGLRLDVLENDDGEILGQYLLDRESSLKAFTVHLASFTQFSMYPSANGGPLARS